MHPNVNLSSKIDRTFVIIAEGRGQASICPIALRQVSVLTELALGHLRYFYSLHSNA